MQINIDIMDDQASYLVQQWLLSHYKMTVDGDYQDPEDIVYNDRLIAAFETVLNYMGVEDVEDRLNKV